MGTRNAQLVQAWALLYSRALPCHSHCHASLPTSSTREIHGDVQEGSVILFMLLLSWSVGLMIEIWVVKEVGCRS